MGTQTRQGVTIIFIINIIKQIYGLGVFELGLDSMSNNNGLSENSQCCRGLRTPNGPCSSSCRTFFTICLMEYQTHISQDPSCTFGKLQTPVLGGNSFSVPLRISNSTFVNPLTLPFKFSWPGTFTLIVTAWHDRTPDQSAQVSQPVVVARHRLRGHVKASDTWKQETFTTPDTGVELKYSYRVLCQESYFGDSCNHSCHPRDDMHGHFRCNESGAKICLDQWTGKYCDKPVCLSGCDTEHGFCHSPNECRCRQGWQGTLCDQCTRYPGCKHGTCRTAFQCECLDGWGGEYCDRDLNYCTHHSPCMNGATCKNSGAGSFSCLCRPGYYGDKCQHRRQLDINDCETNPCLNGGQCKDIGRTYQCVCSGQYHGRHCESNVTTCDGLPCRHGGTCQVVSKNGTMAYKCECASGYTGQDCEMEKDECSSDPCKNGGSCIDEFDAYRCVCNPGYRGHNCEVNINDCAKNPCQNGGVCRDEVDDFICECQSGWVGPSCEENVDDCLSQPCANNGTCQDLTNGFHCTCTPGFTGTDCTTNVDDCAPTPCHNEGICVDLVSDYYCKCKRGFTGRDCKTLADVTAVEPRKEDSSEEEGLTLQHVIIIVCAGVGLPILLILIVVLILLLRRRHSDRRNEVISNDMNKTEAASAKSLNNDKWKSDTLNIIPTSSVCVKINNKITQQSVHSNLSEKEKNYVEKDINTVDGQLQQSRSFKLSKLGVQDKRCNVSSNYVKPDHEVVEQTLDSAYPSQLQVVAVDEASPWTAERRLKPGLDDDDDDGDGDLSDESAETKQPETIDLHRRSSYFRRSAPQTDTCSWASEEENCTTSSSHEHCVDLHSQHVLSLHDNGQYQATEV